MVGDVRGMEEKECQSEDRIWVETDGLKLGFTSEQFNQLLKGVENTWMHEKEFRELKKERTEGEVEINGRKYVVTTAIPLLEFGNLYAMCHAGGCYMHINWAINHKVEFVNFLKMMGWREINGMNYCGECVEKIMSGGLPIEGVK